MNTLTEDIKLGWANPNTTKSPRWHYWRVWQGVGASTLCIMLAVDKASELEFLKNPLEGERICDRCKECLADGVRVL